MMKQHRKELAFILVVLTAVILLAGCNSDQEDKYEAQGFAMGTVISQLVYGPDGQAAIDEASQKIASLEELLTFNDPEGDVYKLNENAGQKKVELNPETVKIIKKAQQVSELSNGAFDITIGPVVKSWGFGTKQEHIPREEELHKLLPLVNYRYLYVGEDSGGLKEKGQMVDLGGIAKGYAGDVAIDIYKKHGIRSAIINLGGNVVTLGGKPDGSPWTVGIRNPRPKANQTQSERIIGYINVKNQAVTTAGDDQRFFEKDGQRYFHILDPRTGYLKYPKVIWLQY